MKKGFLEVEETEFRHLMKLHCKSWKGNWSMGDDYFNENGQEIGTTMHGFVCDVYFVHESIYGSNEETLLLVDTILNQKTSSGFDIISVGMKDTNELTGETTSWHKELLGNGIIEKVTNKPFTVIFNDAPWYEGGFERKDFETLEQMDIFIEELHLPQPNKHLDINCDAVEIIFCGEIKKEFSKPNWRVIK